MFDFGIYALFGAECVYTSSCEPNICTHRLPVFIFFLPHSLCPAAVSSFALCNDIREETARMFFCFFLKVNQMSRRAPLHLFGHVCMTEEMQSLAPTITIVPCVQNLHYIHIHSRRHAYSFPSPSRSHFFFSHASTLSLLHASD